MASLINDFLKPEVAPGQYIPAADVVAWIELDSGTVILEVSRRSNTTYGYRYQAWVAWRDAGDEIRSHSWHLINPKDTLIADSLSETIKLAEKNAAAVGLKFNSDWHSVA